MNAFYESIQKSELHYNLLIITDISENNIHNALEAI